MQNTTFREAKNVGNATWSWRLFTILSVLVSSPFATRVGWLLRGWYHALIDATVNIEHDTRMVQASGNYIIRSIVGDCESNDSVGGVFEIEDRNSASLLVFN